MPRDTSPLRTDEATTSETKQSNRLQKLEYVAHATTLAALVLTYVLQAYTVETNPAAALPLETLGYPLVAGLALATVALAFGVFRRLAIDGTPVIHRWLSDGYPRSALAGAVATASIGLVDVGVNLWLLSRVGLPETTSLATVGALVAFGVAGALVARAVTHWGASVARMYERELRAGAAIVLVFTLVLAPAVGPVSTGSYVGAASASGGTLLDGFEDGSAEDDWYRDGGSMAAVTSGVYEGTYSANSTSNGEMGYSLSDTTPNNLSIAYNASSASITRRISIKPSGTATIMCQADRDGNNDWKCYDGSTFVDTGVNFKQDGNYYIIQFDIHFSSNTFDFEQYDTDGNLVGKKEGIGMQSSVSSVDTLEMYLGKRDRIDNLRKGELSFPDPLKDDVTVKVTDEEGDPISDARVSAFGVNYSQFEPGQSSIKNDSQALDELRNATEMTPEEWLNQREDPFTPTEGTGRFYLNMYSQESLNPEGSLLGVGDNADLENPEYTFEEGEKIYITSWDIGGVTYPWQTGYSDQQLGTLVGTDSGYNAIRIETLDAQGREIDRRTVEIDQTHNDDDLLSNPAGRSTLPYTTVRLSTGFYRVEPAGEGQSFVIKVGDPVSEFMANQANESVEDAQQEYASRVQQLRNKFDSKKFSRTSTYTNESGYATLEIQGARVESVGIQATKVSGTNMSKFDNNLQLNDTLNTTQNMSIQEEEIELEIKQETKTLQKPSDVKKVNLPHNDTVELEMETLSWPVYGNTSDLEDRMEDDFRNRMDDMMGQLNSTWLSRLRNLRNDTYNESELDEMDIGPQNRTEMENWRQKYQNLSQNNENLSKKYQELLQRQENCEPNAQCGNLSTDPNESSGNLTVIRRNITYNNGTNTDYLNDSIQDLSKQIIAFEKAMELMRADLNTTSDSESSSGSNNGSGTADALFTIPEEVQKEDILVMVNQGTTSKPVEDEYLTIEQAGAGPLSETAVRVEDYPINQSDPGMTTFSMRAVTDDGEVAKDEEHVKNPTADGEVPEFTSVRLSEGYAPPGTQTEVDIVPGESKNFGEVSSARVYYPNGSYEQTTVDGNSVNFQTGRPGIHVLRVKMQSIGSDTNFTETVRVRVAKTRQQRPMIRAAAGKTGEYTVVANGIQKADIEQTGDTVSVTAYAEQGQTPADVHIWTQEMSLTPDNDFKVSLLKSTGENYNSNSRIHIHTQALSEDALVYRKVNSDAQPIARDDSQFGVIQKRNGGTVITTATGENGAVTVKTIENPGLVDVAEFRIRKTLASLPSLPFSSGMQVPVDIFPVVGAVLIPLAIRKRRS